MALRLAEQHEKKVTVHIGLHKTGSTAIQQALLANKAALRQQGFAVAVLHRDLPAVHCLFNPGYYGEDAVADFKAAHEELHAWARRTDASHLLISGEDLTPFYWPWRGHGKNLSRLLSGLACQLQLIVYVRRQDRIYESAYLQRLRDGSFSGELAELIADPNTSPFNGNLDWHTKIAEYAEILGTDQISVANYDALLAAGQDIFYDFCKRLSIAQPERLLPSQQVNTGEPLLLLRLQRALQGRLPAVLSRVILALLRRILAYIPKRYLPQPRLLSSAQREEILASYQAANQRLLQSYFPGEKKLAGW